MNERIWEQLFIILSCIVKVFAPCLPESSLASSISMAPSPLFHLFYSSFTAKSDDDAMGSNTDCLLYLFSIISWPYPLSTYSYDKDQVAGSIMKAEWKTSTGGLAWSFGGRKAECRPRAVVISFAARPFSHKCPISWSPGAFFFILREIIGPIHSCPSCLVI